MTSKVSEYFNKLRFDSNHHLGGGDIRLTMGQQDEIEEICAAAIKEAFAEINRRHQIILSEPNGIVRETMIKDLLTNF